MGAVSRAVTENPTSQELDDGWSLEDEGLPLALRSVPETSASIPKMVDEDLGGGWFLADEAEQVVPAVRATSTILNPLTEEELEFFSRAELAMGTEVDFPVPDEAWFDDLRCIVPRKRPASVSDIAPVASAKPQEPELQAAPAPEVEEADASALLAPAPKKARWWKRLRRSKG